MRLRGKWTKLFREKKPEGKTFSRCIRECVPTTDSLWSEEPSREMATRKGPGKGETATVDGFKKTEARRIGTRTEATKGGKVSGGRNNKPAKSASKGQKRIMMGSPMNVKNWKTAKTANSRNSNPFCRFFNEKKCKKGRDCRFAHVCNVLVAPDKVICEEKLQRILVAISAQPRQADMEISSIRAMN